MTNLVNFTRCDVMTVENQNAINWLMLTYILLFLGVPVLSEYKQHGKLKKSTWTDKIFDFMNITMSVASALRRD